MSQAPTVSVIIPSYNDLDNLLICLEALSRQTFPQQCMEIIVVDDGSTDLTAEAVRRIYPGVRLIQKPHTGVDHSRGAGIRAARGSVVAFTDADCSPDPDWLSQIVHDTYSRGYEVVGGRVMFPSVFLARLIGATDFPAYLSSIEREIDRMAGLNWAVRRDLLVQHGFDWRLRGGGDVLLTWELCRAGHRILYDPKVVVTHRPRLALSSFLERKRRYMRNFIQTRRVRPDMPGGWLLRLGPLGALVVILARSALDLYRVRRHWAFLSLRLHEIPLALLLVTAGRMYSLTGVFDGWMGKTASKGDKPRD